MSDEDSIARTIYMALFRRILWAEKQLMDVTWGIVGEKEPLA